MMEARDKNPHTGATLVMKFGGTSVGGAGPIRQVAQIVDQTRAEWPRQVVVTSAMAGVTNLLLESAAAAVAGETAIIRNIADRLRATHRGVIDELLEPQAPGTLELRGELDALIEDFASLCQAIGVLGEATPRALDAVASLGERMCVRLLAGVFKAQGIPAKFVEATRLIVTDGRFQSAHPDLELTAQKTRRFLEPLLDQGIVPVVTGFIAATQDGVTTTLGRGGSDYTAAILGEALPADEVWIWTDVDGVMTADPRLVPGATTIERLTYREIAELAYFGAKVVHPKTIRPVIEAGIPLRVRNTFNPQHAGTQLTANGAGPAPVAPGREYKDFKAVTAIHGQRLVTIEGRGMLGVPGVAARAFEAVATTGTSVPLITQASSEQSICFAVPSQAVERVVMALERIFAAELARRDIDRVWATDEVVIITVVGAGMRNTPGIAGRIFGQLGQRRVNVIAIAQGSSEVSISLVVDAQDAQPAVLALHELIVQSGKTKVKGIIEESV
jgi:aspartokinase/homoserine dehydrogenase 1